MNERTADDPPLCECGCGEYVKAKKYGIWSRWRPGHQYRFRQQAVSTVVQSTPKPSLRLLRDPLPECDEEE